MILETSKFITTGLIWVVVAVVVIAIAVFLVLFLLINKKKAYQVSLRELEKYKDDLLHRPVETKLNRIGLIAKNNIAFYGIHEELKQSYDTLVTLMISEFNSLYQHALKEFDEKSYKSLSQSIEKIRNKLEGFERQLNAIEARVNGVIKDDDRLKNKSFELEERLKSCSSNILNAPDSVSHFRKELNSYLDSASSRLLILNDYIDKGNFLDAEEVAIQIEDTVYFLEENFDSIVRYANALIKELPSFINETIDQYNSMQREGYPMFHINVVDTVQNNTVKLRSLIAGLRKFEMDNYDSEIQSIRTEIQFCLDSLNKEKNDKYNFTTHVQAIYDEAVTLDRDYIKHIKDASELFKTYESNRERAELDNKMKTEVQKLAVVRRDLDALNYGNQPYSYRLAKLNEVEEQSNIVKKYLKLSSQSFEDMKSINIYAEELLAEKSSIVRNLEIDVINAKLEKINLRYEDNFQNAYRHINRIESLLTSTPIDVDMVKEICELLKTEAEDLQINVTRDIRDAKVAESLLKFANNYRYIDFINREVAKAEIYYYDGRYTECSDLLKSILKDKLEKFNNGDNGNEIL